MVAVDGVALLAEGVDRNLDAFDGLGDDRVALLAEGVDRNQHRNEFLPRHAGRPPRGGRG